MNSFLVQLNSTPLKKSTTLAELICRPELNYESLAKIDPHRPLLPNGVKEQVNIQIKYRGYIEREQKQVNEFHKLEAKKIPEGIDYNDVPSLRLEAIQKLNAVKPENIGQASRISGVSPADISVLLIYLKSGAYLKK